MAAYTATQFPLPLAVIPVAVAHSAAPVFIQGVLSALPDWEALGRPDGGPATARERLTELLERLSILKQPPLPQPKRAIVVAAREDGFVPLASTLRLLQHWRGGHVSGLLPAAPSSPAPSSMPSPASSPSSSRPKSRDLSAVAAL